MPNGDSLFSFYEKYGYQTVASIGEFTATPDAEAVPLREVGIEEYARLRRQYLPARAVIQEGEALALLQAEATLYAGRDFVLAARGENGTLFGIELLGNTARAGGILNALQMPSGRVRCVGNTRPFAMYHPLAKTSPPEYLGLALD